MPDDTTSAEKAAGQDSRYAALAAATLSSLADQEARWQKKLKARLKAAPNDEARAALQSAALLSAQDRAWLKAQLG